MRNLLVLPAHFVAMESPIQLKLLNVDIKNPMSVTVPPPRGFRGSLFGSVEPPYFSHIIYDSLFIIVVLPIIIKQVRVCTTSSCLTKYIKCLAGSLTVTVFCRLSCFTVNIVVSAQTVQTSCY